MAIPALAGEVRLEDPAHDAGASATEAREWLPWTAYGMSTTQSTVTRIANGVAVTRSSGDFISLSRRTAPDLASDAIVLRFNLALTGAEEARTAAQVLRVGSDFTTSNVDESDAATYARLGVNTVASGAGFQLRDLVGGANGPTFEGTQAVTWVLNRSGEDRGYSAPDGTRESVGADRMDVWVGRNKVFDEILATTPSAGLTDIKWFWNGGSGTTTIAYFEARPLSDFADGTPVEPAARRAATPVAHEAAPAMGSLQLYRPSPNPFERTTRYAYAIANGAERVEIGVYDVAGRLIRNLARGSQSPGQYEVEWDGRAEDGAHVRQGVYFLRAAIGPQRRVARVVYLLE